MKNIKSLLRTYQQVAYILTTKQKRNSIIVFCSMVMCSCLELLGVSVIYPFLQVMLDENALKEKWYLRWLYLISPSAGMKEGMLTLGIMIIAVYVMKNVVSMLCSFIQFKYAASFHREASTLMLNSFLKRPYEYFVNHNSSLIQRCVYSDTSAVYQILLNGFQIISEIITVFMIGAYLFLTDWFIALLAVALAVSCLLFIVFFFKNKMKMAGINHRNAAIEQSKWLSQSIHGVKEITVLDRRTLFVNQYDKAAKAVEKNAVINNTINAFPDRLLEGICISGFMFIVIIRVLDGTDMATFVPVLGAFAMGSFKILPSISKISSRINNIVFNQVGLNNCYNNLREVREMDKINNKRSGKMVDCVNTNNGDISFNKELRLKSVTWKYKNSQDNVLEQLDLVIFKGESVAFIGESGAGKTTLADIILGLLEPQAGTVEMDGIDIFAIPHQWSKIIGYVPQNVYLIDNTVRANVAFGLPKDDVDDEKVWYALEQAQLKDFVEKLPHKLDTYVGERGVKFSGGQRQRIAIARALYENPDILVLDEATSALDNETEKAVMESIEALQGVKTLIIVAHRLSTIRNCNKIIQVGNKKAVLKNKSDIIEA